MRTLPNQITDETPEAILPVIEQSVRSQNKKVHTKCCISNDLGLYLASTDLDIRIPTNLAKNIASPEDRVNKISTNCNKDAIETIFSNQSLEFQCQKTSGNINTLDDEYKHSNEHKAMVRAITVNVVVIVLIIIIMSFMTAIMPVYKLNIMIFLVFDGIFLLYRTFASIASAIYCYEVVNRLSKNVMSHIWECVQNACNTIRSRI